MSTIQEKQTVWPGNDNINAKYEKCLNITEEIYKRINITFQIKKLETASQSNVSDQSDQIDSNELSNETDLFACDKSSISSSTEAEKPVLVPTKYVNINNNEEKPRPAVVYKKPRKRFRKRVKKRQTKKQSESDGSSDEALPLSRIVDVDIDKCLSEGQESADNVMGVPNIILLAKDMKPKTKQNDKKVAKKYIDTKHIVNEGSLRFDEKKEIETSKSTQYDNVENIKSPTKDAKISLEMKCCTMCNLPFRGERGLRRHIAMSHIVSDATDEYRRDKETKPA
ncbi:unnamed protein product [Diatraea saccharalis]|uniref:C2H2-type domain-containing protein n=1 Tax=Diatraea saccharalis TaxID=40085 RepID=A0A9N9R5D9_9NEOP|nr:unnamed protein product [Diatraea saccharalis]